MLAKLKFGTYIFFGAFCLLMFLWVFFFLPETRYKSLEEMDLVFGDNSGAADQERMEQIMAEVGLEPGSGHGSTTLGDAKSEDMERFEEKESK